MLGTFDERESTEKSGVTSLGRVSFLGIPVHVAPCTFSPREETELLAREAIAVLHNEGIESPIVVDVCCGVGNLAVALACNVPRAQVWAADLAAPCVAAARHNVVMLGIEDRVRVARGDLFGALAGEALDGRVDMIVCNPPYISSGRLERDRRHLLAYEPREAFDAGPYGLTFHQRLIAEATALLRPGGWLLFEFGEGQARQVRALFDRSGRYGGFRTVRDDAGSERVAVARFDSGGLP